MIAYHLPDVDEFQRFESLLRALRCPYIANLLDSWVDENGEGWLVVERGGVRLNEFLEQAESHSDATLSSVLMSVSSTMLFLYQHGYVASIQASSFMQFGDMWLLVDLFGALFPIETVKDPVQRDMFAFAQHGAVVQAVVDGTFSCLQLPMFATQHLGLLTLELLLSSPLFPGRSSKEVFDLVLNEELRDTTYSHEELRILQGLSIITLGYHGRCSEMDAILELASLLQDHILPSFDQKGPRPVAGCAWSKGRRHYYSRAMATAVVL